ncbi:hypothetical protein CVIRNUC_011042 [Coccomyxa viridis]|uniref:Uncharacterized protein n=1 Tax=Coccomyxa viridis TaxID=1274662 RepID=A0AAV1INW5_9CHLO|nr:hypothetical protein CVIRNUC_011042 [Coccomyxa viridis]
MGRFKSTLDAVQRMHRLCRLGGHPAPAWLDAWSDMESIHMLSALKRKKSPREAWPKTPRIEYPEDPLVQSYYARNPDAKDHMVMLNSFEPPPARVFAWRQLRLMREQGLSRKQAQRAVQAREDSGQRRDVGKQNIVLQLQRQEERALIEALNRLPED